METKHENLEDLGALALYAGMAGSKACFRSGPVRFFVVFASLNKAIASVTTKKQHRPFSHLEQKEVPQEGMVKIAAGACQMFLGYIVSSG